MIKLYAEKAVIFIVCVYYILLIIHVDFYFSSNMHEIRITVVVLNHNFLKYICILIIAIHVLNNLSKLILNCLTVFLPINPCQNFIPDFFLPVDIIFELMLPHLRRPIFYKKSEKWNMVCVHTCI